MLALVACTPHPVGPARTFASFEGKAATTAESAKSAVETVRLSADAGASDHAFGPFLSISISDQEETLSGIQGTFASIQPPNEQADELRAELDDLLSAALDHVAAVRIAARRGELAKLAAVAEPLATDSDHLEQFLQEHQR
jgi:hypothetical protein